MSSKTLNKITFLPPSTMPENKWPQNMKRKVYLIYLNKKVKVNKKVKDLTQKNLWNSYYYIDPKRNGEKSKTPCFSPIQNEFRRSFQSKPRNKRKLNAWITLLSNRNKAFQFLDFFKKFIKNTNKKTQEKRVEGVE